MQIFAIVVSLAIAAVGIALFVQAIRSIVATLRIGQPAVGRSDHKGARWANMLKETLGHTRMLQWTAVGVGSLVRVRRVRAVVPDPGHRVRAAVRRALRVAADRALVPVRVGLGAVHGGDAGRDRGVHRLPGVASAGSVPGASGAGSSGRRCGRGTSSSAVILGVGLCIVVLRGAEYAISPVRLCRGGDRRARSTTRSRSGSARRCRGCRSPTLANVIYLVAMVKIVISFTWMIVISRNLTMGVAWHRFTRVLQRLVQAPRRTGARRWAGWRR